MKFAERLAAHITPEWNSQYIKYDDMKEFLYQYERDAPILDEEHLLQRYYAKGDEEFFRISDKELAKINTFFAEKLAEAQRKYETLKNELIDSTESNERRRFRFGGGGGGGGGAGGLSSTGGSGGARASTTLQAVEDDQDDDDLAAGNGLLDGGKRRNGSTKARKRSLFGARSTVDDDEAGNAAGTGVAGNVSFAQRLLEKNRERQIKQKKYRKEHDLKLAFSEFYLSLILLQNYQTLNFTGFRKILKKHDKIFKTDRGSEWHKAYVETAIFNTTKKVDTLISDVENLFTEKLENGNKQRAMKRLRVPPFEEKLSSWTTFRLGLFLGMVCVLVPVIIAILALSYVKYGEFAFNWKVAIKLYRSSLFLIIHLFFIGINSYGWSRSGVNHVLIFEIDPRNHLSYQQLLETGTCLAVFWSLSLIAFVVSAFFGVEYYIQPLLMVIFLFVYILNPVPKFQYRSRIWLLRILWQIFCAPFYHVQFAHFWLADQLTSFDFLFSDLQFFVCWFLFQAQWSPFKGFMPESSCLPVTNRDLACAFNVIALFMACLPSWLRFMQCLRRYKDTSNAFPHLANALKYATTFFDIGALALKYHFSHMYASDWENPFFYLWLIIKVSATGYKYMWDIKMDWGFFDKNAGENRFLREVIVYSSKGYYYFAIVENLVIRFMWLIRLYDIGLEGETYKDIVTTALGFLEVFRRFVWNFFRLENEHLNNCGQFRAVRDISISPIQVTDLNVIEKMMDEEDGVINRQHTLSLNPYKTTNQLTITKRILSKHPTLANITKRFNGFSSNQLVDLNA